MEKKIIVGILALIIVTDIVSANVTYTIPTNVTSTLSINSDAKKVG